MLVIPAVDIKEGKCVRLLTGIKDKELFSIAHPERIAKQWEERGAKLLHVVDIDSAFSGGQKNNKEVILKILKEVKIPVQVGGGVNSEDVAELYIDNGAAYIILSTIIFSDRKTFEKISAKFPKNVKISLDVDENLMLRIRGWVGLGAPLSKFLEEIINMEFFGFVCTVISRDGTLQGADIQTLTKVLKLINPFGKNKIASGGIKGEEELTELKKLGFDGAIVGRGFYENKIKVFEI